MVGYTVPAMYNIYYRYFYSRFTTHVPVFFWPIGHNSEDIKLKFCRLKVKCRKCLCFKPEFSSLLANYRYGSYEKMPNFSSMSL